MGTLEKLKEERGRYAEEWGINSADHEARGDYSWMATFIEGYPKVLEVGIGTGGGTLALVRAGHAVVGVDENPDCLNLAEAHLNAGGYATAKVRRGRAEAHGRHYDVMYDPVLAPVPTASRPAVLVEGFVGFDLPLRDWLVKVGPFDAICCWLIGAQQFLGAHVLFTIPQMQVYVPHGGKGVRHAVHHELYRWADRILRPGGVLHFVDRGEYGTDEERRSQILGSRMDAHREHAAGTSMVVESADSIRWRPPARGVLMQRFADESGRLVGDDAYALASVLVRKR